MSEVITTGEKSGVKLEEYNGAYSLSSQNKSGDKFYPVWAKYKKNKTEYQVKDWPVKVVLGTKEEAMTVLKTIYKEISGVAPAEKKPEPPPKKDPEPDVKDFDDGIPF